MNQSPHILAICSIDKVDDDQNKCALTRDHLYITRKGKQHVFELDQVTQIVFKQKKLLLPIVFGGIVGSLFLIAGFNFLINIWLALIIGLAGILLFYYGWVGRQALVLYTKVKEYDIFIDQVTSPLEAFISMINKYFILGKSKTIKYYLILTEEAWQEASLQQYITPPAKGLRLSTDPYVSGNGLVFSIDPTEISNPINYHLEESSQTIVPFIFEQIDITHLIPV